MTSMLIVSLLACTGVNEGPMHEEEEVIAAMNDHYDAALAARDALVNLRHGISRVPAWEKHDGVETRLEGRSALDLRPGVAGRGRCPAFARRRDRDRNRDGAGG